MAISTQRILKGASTTLNSPLKKIDYKSPGQKLIGWATNKEAATSEYVDGQNYTFNSDTKLYAVWETKTVCTIKFDSQGGDEIASMEVEWGSEVGDLPTTEMEVPEDSPEGMAGMNFIGWFTLPEGGDEVTSTATVPTGLVEITLYAHWEGVIRCRPVYKNTNSRISVDANGVASGFTGSASSDMTCALESIPDDKFDFSGEFTIVMRCQAISNRHDYNTTWNGNGASRCDVFGGYNVEGT